MRMFAGPNGSGKSTLKSVLRPELLGVYLNPDEIERELKGDGFLELSKYGITVTQKNLEDYFLSSELYQKSGSGTSLPTLQGTRLVVANTSAPGYTAAAITDFLREQLLRANISFTFETVMSHPSKIDILKRAKALGYKTYLYYVATSDADINVNRVENRVKRGGHSVPIGKIRNRYADSLKLLAEAIKETDRAYIFDNSIDSSTANAHTWIAEITSGYILEFKSAELPAWFQKYVLEKLV